MDNTGTHPGAEHAHAHAHAHGHDEHHEELGFWRKYVFSVDHKVIGIQYTITALLFLLVSTFSASAAEFRIATFSTDVTIPIGHPCMGGGISPAK